MVRAFVNIPFFRILIPLVVGILLAIAFSTLSVNWLWLPLLALIIVMLAFVKVQPNWHQRLLLGLAEVFLLLLGIVLVRQTELNRSQQYYGKYVKADEVVSCIAVINELPVEKARFIKCNVRLLAVKQGATYKAVNGQLICYFKRSSQAMTLKAGQVLLVKTKLSEVPGPKNPYEFDYKTYLLHQQIFHTAFVDSNTFAVLSVTDVLNPIWKAGLACKATILNSLKHSELTASSYAICAALLTGYDDDIERPVMDAFAHSGTLHVLSVSGLHTGLLYLALGFLIDLADRQRRYKLLKFIIVTLFLWGFALITGFSAPVLRAVIMFNLLGLGKIYFRNDHRNQLNILCVSAFILLLYDPYFITNTGFLLSYFAMLGLIYFQPALGRLWQPHNMALNWGWQSITASVAATISTLPLTLFYFKQFPIWFFVCNLAVVPATFAVLLLTILLLLHLPLAAWLINRLVAGLLWFIQLFNAQGFGFVDSIDFNVWDALFLSAFIVLCSVAIQYRSYRLVLSSFIILACWQLLALVQSYNAKQQQLFLVYQLRNNSQLALKNKTSTVLSPVNTADYNYHIKPHVVSFNNTSPRIQPFNYVAYNNKAVLILNQPGCWPKANLRDVNTLVLCNNFRLLAVDLQRFKQLSSIVADGSNNNYTLQKTEELSRKFGLYFYATKHKGAYLLALN